jgi:hypothetical protein
MAQQIESVRDLMQVLRTLRYSTRPGYCDFSQLGGYTLVFVTADGNYTRPSSVLANLGYAARAIRDGDCDRVVAFGTYDEGEPEEDFFTGEDIESSYGDPEAKPRYTYCACRDCMYTTVSSDTRKPELCSDCEDAGCDCDGASECARDDAYGCDREEG